MDLSAYDILLLLHVILFVYWLGADMGVFYAAGYAADARYSPETRHTIAEIMAFVDLAPRLSVPLIGAVGASLGALSNDLSLHTGGLAAVWFVALVWVGVNVTVYINRHQKERVKGLLTFDPIWRVGVLVVVAAAGLASLFGAGVTDNRSLAVKMIIYAAAIFMSLVLRVLFRPYRPALARIVAGEGGPADDETMKSSLSIARPAIVGIWILTVLAAAVGLWQPF